MHSSSLIQTENWDNLITTRHLKTKQKNKQDSANASTLSKKPTNMVHFYIPTGPFWKKKYILSKPCLSAKYKSNYTKINVIHRQVCTQRSGDVLLPVLAWGKKKILLWQKNEQMFSAYPINVTKKGQFH